VEYLYILIVIILSIPIVLASSIHRRYQQMQASLLILSNKLAELERVVSQSANIQSAVSSESVSDSDSTLNDVVASAEPPSHIELPSIPAPPLTASTKLTEKRTNAELEMLLGGKLLNRIGAVATILGVMFFLKYAFDNNWITEWARVLIGVATSGVLIVVADRLKKKNFVVVSQGVVAAAIPILYLAVFAAFDFYHLIPQLVAYLCLVGVTVLTVWLATVHKSLFVGMASIVGAVLTPVLVSDGTVNSTGLLLHAFLLVLAFTAIPMWLRKWYSIGFVGGLGALFLVGMLSFELSGFNGGDLSPWPLVDILLLQLIMIPVIGFDVLLNSNPSYGNHEARKGWVASIYFFIAIITNNELSDYSWYIDAGGQILFTIICAALLIENIRRYGSKNATASLIATLTFVTALTIVPTSVDTFYYLAGIAGAIFIASVWYRNFELRVPAFAIYTICAITMWYIVGSHRTYWAMDSNTAGDSTWLYPVLNLRFFAIAAMAIASYVAGKFMLLHRNGRVQDWPSTFRVFGYGLLTLAIATDVHHVVYEIVQSSTQLGVDLLAQSHSTLTYISQTAGIMCAILLGAVMYVVARFGQKQYMALGGVLVASVGSIVWLILCISSLPEEMYNSILNLRFEAGFVVLVCIATIALYSVDEIASRLRSVIKPLMWSLFAVVSFILISTEAIWPFVVQLTGDRLDDAPVYDSLHLTLSITWLLYAVAVLTLGFIKKLRVIRITGIGLLGLSILKIFLYDLSYLAQLERIFSFIILGIILLAASFAYQRYFPKGES